MTSDVGLLVWLVHACTWCPGPVGVLRVKSGPYIGLKLNYKFQFLLSTYILHTFEIKSNDRNN